MNTRLRRTAARAIALTVATGAMVTGTVVTGALTSSASAATSGRYFWESDCLAAQRAAAGSFVRITKRCSVRTEAVKIAGGVWSFEDVWRFEYVVRTS